MDQKYDIIGDIHGHAKPLRALLEKLGYREADGHYFHPERKAIFLGDFIDRGPAIREVLQIVRGMTDAGNALAVLGNHESNALAYHTPDGTGGFLRPHSDEKISQHQATLDQIANPFPDEWEGWLDWFRTLPFFLDLGVLRVVHAAWDDSAVAAVRNLGPVTPDKLAALVDEKTTLGHAKQVLLHGLEIDLPVEHRFIDKQGHNRKDIRTRWWMDIRGMTYREAVFPDCEEIPSLPIPLELVPTHHSAYPADAPPVLFGHHWVPGTIIPALQSPNVACLDYSVAKDGPLVAYRWDGEAALDADKIVSVENAWGTSSDADTPQQVSSDCPKVLTATEREDLRAKIVAGRLCEKAEATAMSDDELVYMAEFLDECERDSILDPDTGYMDSDDITEVMRQMKEFYGR